MPRQKKPGSPNLSLVPRTPDVPSPTSVAPRSTTSDGGEKPSRYATTYATHGERTPQARAAILAALRLGVPMKLAASAGGYSESGFHTWLRSDPEFREQTKQARAQFVAEALQRIATAAEEPRNWTAAAWMLERRFPDLFGRTVQKIEQKTTITGAVAHRLEIVYVDDWRGKGNGDGEGETGDAGDAGVRQYEGVIVDATDS